MSEPSAAPANVLLIRRRYLGDIVLLNPAIRSLRQHWPDARITLLCDRGYAGGAALHGDLDEVLAFPDRVSDWWRLWRRLRHSRFTHVLDFDNRDKTAAIAWASRAPQRLTFARDHPKFPLRHRWVYTGLATIDREWHDSHHITEIYQTLVARLGVPMAVPPTRFRLRESEVAAMRRLVGGDPSTPKVVVHPGSRSQYRVWPPQRFAAVCDRLQEVLGVQIFLVGGRGEAATIEAIRAAAGTHLVAITQPLSVPELTALFAHVDVLLAHDSGPMHLAAGVGTPVVALYGSQNATIWRPVGAGHRLLQTALPCPCFPAGTTPTPCVKNDAYFSYCVRQLEVDEVYAAVEATLAQRSVQR
ncbi:MAG TPA: glycosyltransferase family 9 protein [Candidatus Synoicihabitans sp.]|nr:glycosyltransferase family 9 protein [Candidatus Synoicihabitans sp.]